jgi:hypothetical protein
MQLVDDRWSQLDEAMLKSAGACACELIFPLNDVEAREKRLLLPRGTRNNYIRNAVNTEEIFGLTKEALERMHDGIGPEQAEAGPQGPPPGTILLLRFIGSLSRRGQSADIIFHDTRQLVENVVQTGERCRLDGLITAPKIPNGTLPFVYTLHWEPDPAKNAGQPAVVARFLFAPNKDELERLLIVAAMPWGLF